ncbi:MAG: hypothetical protein JST58_02805 [Bacteroidetes bacterium]|nr:hypothetical protein [Bacteroidota bacterium]
MKKLSILIILFLGCNSSSDTTFKAVKELDYTFDSGWKEAYSVKINHEGFCIVGDGRWGMKYYTGHLLNKDVHSLDSLIQKIPFKEYDSAYHEDVVDQASYKIVLVSASNDTTTKFVYGRTAPKVLNDLSNHIRLIKENLKLIESDTVVSFKSRENFFPKPITTKPQ